MTAGVLRSAIGNARRRQRAAALPPYRLLGLSLFWTEHPAFVGLMVGAVAAFVGLARYTYAPAGGWEWLVLLVQSLAVWGAVLTARALAAVQVERAIVNEIEARGATFLRELKSGQRARIDLDELEQAILPSNPSEPPPAMIRLFQHIIKEARDRKFESSVSVMQPYREEPLEDIFKLQNLQKVALWLGILGTFIGLLLAMQAADVARLLNSGELIELVKKMFEGMIVSFSASLAGLQVAVILGFCLLVLRHRQEPYFKEMETAVVTMLSLARNAINKDAFIAELAQISSTVTTLSDRVHQQARELNKTQERISEQTNKIGEGMKDLTEASAAFDGFLERIADAQNQFIADVRKVYDMISLNKLGETVQNSVGRAAKMMSDEITVGTGLIDQRLKEFNSAVSDISEAFLLQASEAGETAKKLQEQVSGATSESLKTMLAVARQVQEIITRDTRSTQTLRAELTELSRHVSDLGRSIDRLGNLPGPRTRSISSFIGSLRW